MPKYSKNPRGVDEILFHQPKTLSLKARVDTREFFTKPAHRAHRLLEELMTNDAPPALELQRTAHLILRHGGCRRDVKRRAPSRQGAGCWCCSRRWPDLARGPGQSGPAA